MMRICENDMLKVLKENFETVKSNNRHADRMYILGLIMVLQFSDNQEIINIVSKIHTYLNSSLPSTDN